MTRFGGSRHWLLAFLWLALLACVSASHQLSSGESSSTISSVSYQWYCDMTMNPEVTLEWDPNRNEYTLQNSEGLVDYEDDNNYPMGGDTGNDTVLTNSTLLGDGGIGGGEEKEPEKDPWTRRLWNVVTSGSTSTKKKKKNDGHVITRNLRSPLWLPFSDTSVHPALAVASNSSYNTARLTQELPMFLDGNGNGNNHSQHGMHSFGDGHDGFITPTIQARACHCWETQGVFYCPLPRTYCAIPSSPHIGFPACIDSPKQGVIISIWPVLVVWYAALLFCLSFTKTGRHAMGCCIATIYPAWNQHIAERIARDDPNQTNQMLLSQYRILRLRYERRLRRRLRRRAIQDRRRARRRTTAVNNNNNNGDNLENLNSSSESELVEELPFPHLWDLAIIPRPVNTVPNQPQPTSLTLKTRIYKQKNKHDDIINDTTSQEDKTKVETFVEELDSSTTEKDAQQKDTAESKTIVGTEKDPFFGKGRPEKEDAPLQTLGDNTEEVTSEAKEICVDTDETKLRESHDVSNERSNGTDGPNKTIDPTHNQPPAMSPPPHGHDLSEWDDNTCAICYVPLEDGDRVGALPCGHEFHVHPCLKHWLSRRNVCPLCLTENIATPRFADGTLATPDRNNDVESGATMPPVVSTFDPTRNDNISDSSDQDRSSSRDGGDDNSSGILDGDPNVIPAFSSAPTNRRRPRAIELTTLFRRRRSTPQDNDSNPASPVERAS
jgi:Ring finger domain